MRTRCLPLVLSLSILSGGSLALAQPVPTQTEPNGPPTNNLGLVEELWSCLQSVFDFSLVAASDEAGGTFEPDGKPAPNDQIGSDPTTSSESTAAEADAGGTFEPDGAP